MHSFRPARGRILFETLCALALAASLAAAWQQTGASALLGASLAAALFGLSHAFGARRGPAVAVEPQRIEFEPETPNDLPASEEAIASVEPQLTVDSIAEEVEATEPAAPRAGTGRRKGGSRKGTGRRAKAPKDATVTQLEPIEEAAVVVPISLEESEAAELAPFEEAAHPHIAPLFEPAPYVHVRQQRTAFGRKAR